MFNTSIAVIEDQIEMLEIYKEILSKIENSIIATFSNPLQGLDYALKNKPDIVITDNFMPYVDGVYVAGAIKEVYNPKIILASSMSARGNKFLNFDRHIQKPFDILELLNLVKILVDEVNNTKSMILDRTMNGMLGDINLVGKDRLFIESAIKTLMYDSDRMSENSIYTILSERMEKDESTIRRNINKTIDKVYEPSLFEKIGFARKPKNKEFIDQMMKKINEKAKNERWD